LFSQSSFPYYLDLIYIKIDEYFFRNKKNENSLEKYFLEEEGR